MGDQQRAKAHGQPLGQYDHALPRVDPCGNGAPAVKHYHEQQAQTYARDNIGVHHGDVVHRRQGIACLAAHTVEADGGKRTAHGGDDGGKEGDKQRNIHAVHNETVVQKLGIPVEREALPHGGAVSFVEGENNQDEDGGIEEQTHQQHQQAIARVVLLTSDHSITACSSPSPKRFITSMQMTTTAIITKEMAAPSWGLYAPPRN